MSESRISPDAPEFYDLNPPSIIVDDFDHTIRYSGTWNAVNETSLEEEVDIEPSAFERVPMFHTLHVLQVFSGSFSYDFAGGGISVFATPSDNSNYTSQCFVDGHQLSFDPNVTKAQFGQSRPVCQAFGLPDNIVHTLSVNVSVPPRQRQDTTHALSGFAFDYMLIQPPSGMSPWDEGNGNVVVPVLDQSGIITNAPNPTLNFGLSLRPSGAQIADVNREWEFDPENGFHTITPAAQFNVTFTGTSLWWYGYHTITLDTVIGETATFSIDGGAPSTFDVPYIGFPSATSQLFLFRTPVLQYATHLLTVEYHGKDLSYPLTLQSLIIQKSMPTVAGSTMPLLPSTTTSKLPASATMSKMPTSPLVTKHRKIGGTVGGIAGGVIFLLLVASGGYLLALWRRRRQKYIQSGANSTTATQEPFPVPTDDTSGILVPRNDQPDRQNIPNHHMQQLLPPPPLTKWTRRHTISGSPGRTSESATTIVHQQGLPGSRINHTLIQPHFQSHPRSGHTTNRQSPAQRSDEFHLTTHGSVISSSLPAYQLEREEESGIQTEVASVLPPLYATH